MWAVLCAILVFSLLGVADHAHRINLDNLTDPAGADLFAKITGRGIWLVGVTLSESALSTLEFPWLWSGLLFALVSLAAAATAAAVFETVSASVADEWPNLRQYKPAVAFTALAAVFLVNLLMATEVRVTEEEVQSLLRTSLSVKEQTVLLVRMWTYLHLEKVT